jgi:hypothetical protein
MALLKTYANHKPSPDGLTKIIELRHLISDLHRRIEQIVPASRERSVALTQLEATAMWSIKAIVLNDPNSVEDPVVDDILGPE